MRTIMYRLLTLGFLLLLNPQVDLHAQEGQDSPDKKRPVNGDKAEKAYKANLVKYKNVSDVLVLPGLLASRKEKKIEIMGESTGLRGKDLVEFLLVDQNSSHGYEALLWSFAKPSDVHKALVFVGVPPGEPYNPGQLRFAPKGELISLSVVETNASGGSTAVRIENLILDLSADKPLPESGFVFTGSIEVPVQGRKEGLAYAADITEAKSIASLFNDPTTVMDVPRQASQGEVYNHQVVNPEYELEAGQLLSIVLEPLNRDGKTSVTNLVMEIALSAASPAGTNSSAGAAGKEIQYDFFLKDSDGKALGKGRTIEDAINTISGLKKTGLEVYLSVTFRSTISLSAIRKACFVLRIVEAAVGVRIEPPSKGQLYYRAFMPDEVWRHRKDRMVQPWELRLTRKKDKVAGTLFKNEQVWADEKSIEPEIKTTAFTVPTPQAFREKLDADAKERKSAGKNPALPVLLVFAEPGLTYGDLMKFVEPVLSTYNTVYVFDVEQVPSETGKDD